MVATVRLTDDEIRTLAMIEEYHSIAQGCMRMAKAQEAQTVARLRAKYGLDDNWQVRDYLTGFERVQGGEDGTTND